MFFEISTSLNHKVDDLLVGILTAIEKHHKNIQKQLNRLEKISDSKRESRGSIKPNSSIYAIKSPKNNIVKFLKKIFRLQK